MERARAPREMLLGWYSHSGSEFSAADGHVKVRSKVVFFRALPFTTGLPR